MFFVKWCHSLLFIVHWVYRFSHVHILYSSNCSVLLSFFSTENMSLTLLPFLRPFCVQWLFPHQARSSGKFSSEELSNLKREFQHHKDKIHEYNILMDTVSRTEGELVNHFALLPSRGGVGCGQVCEPINPILLSTLHHCHQFAVAQVTHPKNQSEMLLSSCSV